jgi:hypothetical protein
MEPQPGLDQFLAENVNGVSVDAQAVLAHVIRPPNFDDVSPDGGPRANTVPLQPVQPPPSPPYYLDVAAFEIALDNALKDGVAGYAAQLRQSGQILFTKTLEYAKRRPQDGDELWKSNVKMHVASVSKLMTAMAMTVLLRDHNISPDAQIIDYLPDYWAKGPNIEYIVFRNLLNHTSGLSADYRVDFDKMKSAIAGGINLPIAGGTNPNTLTLGQYKYQNLNYGLFRILLAVINGYINKNLYWGLPPISDPVNDQIWDAVTIAAYEAYLQAKVFGPSSVGGATLDHPPGCALAYKGPDDTKHGWNSGSLRQGCGCFGWHLSVNDLLDVMGQFRRGNGILTSADAQAMLDNGFGVDPLMGDQALPAAFTTLAGNLYCKPGNWNNTVNQDEQSLAFFLPQDMELAVFVNSMVDGQTGSTNLFREVVKQAYVESLLPPPVHHL